VRGPRLVRVRVASRRQPPADGEPHIWGRVVGQHGLQGCAANLEKDVDYDMFAVQAGMDLYYAEGPDGGSDRAGIYGAIGNASGEAHLFDVSVGSNDNGSYTVSGYWTHYGRQGWYVDAILQGTWYDIKADSDRPFSLSTNGFGLGASPEAGYPFPLASGWIVEPQAQLAYQPGARGSIVGRRDEQLDRRLLAPHEIDTGLYPRGLRL
jgi:outer membrane autotransporter protein